MLQFPRSSKLIYSFSSSISKGKKKSRRNRDTISTMELLCIIYVIRASNFNYLASFNSTNTVNRIPWKTQIRPMKHVLSQCKGFSWAFLPAETHKIENFHCAKGLGHFPLTICANPSMTSPENHQPLQSIVAAMAQVRSVITSMWWPNDLAKMLIMLLSSPFELIVVSHESFDHESIVSSPSTVHGMMDDVFNSTQRQTLSAYKMF